MDRRDAALGRVIEGTVRVDHEPQFVDLGAECRRQTGENPGADLVAAHIEHREVFVALEQTLDVGKQDGQVGEAMPSLRNDHPDPGLLQRFHGFAAPEVRVDQVEVRDRQGAAPFRCEVQREVDRDLRLAAPVITHQDDSMRCGG
jgi:hypothetical protein